MNAFEVQNCITLFIQSNILYNQFKCDAWISWNYLASWEIIGCFTSEKNKLECLFLSWTKIQRSHIKESQTDIILAILTSQNICN